MPNQFLSDEFGDIEDYFVTDYWLIDNFVGDQLWVWGINAGVILGINDTTNRSTPVTTFAGGTTWKSVSGGKGNYTAAIKTDGSLWTWGFNNAGQLGDNTTTNRSTPVTTFAGGNTWKQVSGGSEFAAVIKTDGSLWTWGRNNFGQLGINQSANNFTGRTTPVTTFAGGNNWKSVAGGEEHTAAIKTDGSLWTWGRNAEGQLGDNTATSRITPVTTLLGGNDWKSVACGKRYTLAIKTDGSLWTWGFNNAGQLGDNTTTNRSTPVTTFAGGTNWKSVAGGEGHTAAIKTDGSLWTWGGGGTGCLGTNDTTSRSTPVATFAGGTNWKSVACGSRYTSAIKTDGTLWTWGNNFEGQLGDNTTTQRNVPVTTFAGGNNWKSVSSGGYHTSAVKSGLNVDLSFFPVGFVTDGLALYLDAGNTASYPGSGTTWTDLSGNGRNGTLTSMDGTNFNSANGGSLTFNGSDDYVQCSGSLTLTAATFIVWIRRNGDQSQYDGILFNRFAYITGMNFQSSNQLAYTWNNETNTYQWQSNLILPNLAWSMCAISVSGSSATAYLCQSSGITSATNNVSHLSTFMDHIEIARDEQGGARYFTGNIAQALIYNRALSATEIQQNFNFSKPRFGL